MKTCTISKTKANRSRVKLTTGTILLQLIITTISAEAAIYHVSTSGRDTADGSLASPWRTIQKAADTMTAGDTAIIQAGTYPERVDTKSDGTATNPITFSGDRDATIVGAWWIDNTHIVLDGFTVDGSQLTGAQGGVTVAAGGDFSIVRNVFFNGSPYYGYYHINPVTDCTLEFCRIENPRMHGLSLLGSGHIIKNNYFHSRLGADVMRILSSDTTVSNNFIDNWGNPFLTSGELQVGNTYKWFDVSGSPDFSNVGAGSPPYSVGQYFKATSTTPNNWGTASVQNTNHTDLFQSFSVLGNYTSQNVIIEKNLAVNCDYSQIGNFEDQAGAMGPKHQQQVSDWTMRNNIFVDVGYQMNGYIENFHWHNNTFIRCSTGITGLALYFNHSGDPFTFSSGDVSVPVNTITANGDLDFTDGSGVKLFGDLPSPLTASTVYYAKIISGSTFTLHTNSSNAINGINPIDLTTSGSDSMSVIQSRARGSSHGSTIYNNIFYHCGTDSSNPGRGWYYIGSANNSIEADYNLVFGTGNGTSKNNFQSGSFEANGINGIDPLINDPTKLSGSPRELTGWDGVDPDRITALMNRFALQPSSPAIGAGKNGGTIGFNTLTPPAPSQLELSP